MRKAIVIMLALVMAFSVLPVSYLYWTGQLGNWRLQLPIVLANTPPSVIFTNVDASDNEGSKDVAQIAASITSDGRGIVTAITNAYPGYEGSVDFTVTNNGSLDIQITSITVTNPNELEVNISLALGVLEPLESRDGLLVYGITQQAAQNAPYTFTIAIVVEEY